MRIALTMVHTRAAVVAVSMLAACVSDAAACFCATPPTCAALGRAETVFTGRVTTIEALTPASDFGPRALVRLTVRRTLRGTPLTEVVLYQYGTNCDFGFRANEEYLVLTHRQADGHLNASICSGTKLLSEAAADIATIETLLSQAPLGRVYGTVQRTVRDLASERSVRDEPTAGVRVVLTGDGSRRETRTDSSGTYEIAQVSPGKYQVRALVPEKVRVYPESADVDVIARACEPLDLRMVSDGRISGYLRLADGSPVAAAPVSLLRADVDTGKGRAGAGSETRYSNAQGAYSFEGILPGQYYLHADARPISDSRMPHASRYYPDATDRRDAYVIELAEGERLTTFDFTLKPTARTVVTGVVVDRNGMPIGGTYVMLTTPDTTTTVSSASANAAGRFQLKALVGQPYVLTAGTASVAIVATEVPEPVTLVSAPPVIRTPPIGSVIRF